MLSLNLARPSLVSVVLGYAWAATASSDGRGAPPSDLGRGDIVEMLDEEMFFHAPDEDALALLQMSSVVELRNLGAPEPARPPASLRATLAAAAVEGKNVLAAKMRIMGRAMANATAGGFNEIRRGNVTGAFRLASEAASEASQQSALVTATMSTAGSKGLGVALVFVFVAAGWGLELLLTKPRSEEADGSEPRSEEAEDGVQSNAHKANHYMAALNFLRFAVACHVVMYNFYPSSDDESDESSTLGLFASWGIMSSPWFFMISGFVYSYTRYVNPSVASDDWLQVLFQRVLVWYPLFVFSITWCALRYFSTAAEDWSHFMSQLLLVHGFMWDHSYFPFYVNDRWLSFLAVYLLTWWPMHCVLADSSSTNIRILFYVAWAVTIPSMILEWWFMHDWSFFNMIQFWPSFVIGQALATWFVKTCMQQKVVNVTAMQSVWILRPVHEIPTIVRFGASIGALFFGILYFAFPPHWEIPGINKPITPLLIKGGLLPLQALMLAGLACEVDPLARVVARRPFRWLGKLSLSMFLLQVPLYGALKDLTGWAGLTWTFWLILLFASGLCHYGYERPWRHFLRARTAALAAAAAK